MQTDKSSPTNIDEYIAGFPKHIRELLEVIRVLISHAAPEAEEAISYQMPTFKLKGNLVHFAAFKNHIGLYPTPKVIGVFEKELSLYKSGKGSIQFPLEKPLPKSLITEIVKYRVKENIEKDEAKKNSIH